MAFVLHPRSPEPTYKSKPRGTGQVKLSERGKALLASGGLELLPPPQVVQDGRSRSWAWSDHTTLHEIRTLAQGKNKIQQVGLGHLARLLHCTDGTLRASGQGLA